MPTQAAEVKRPFLKGSFYSEIALVTEIRGGGKDLLAPPSKEEPFSQDPRSNERIGARGAGLDKVPQAIQEEETGINIPLAGKVTHPSS